MVMGRNTFETVCGFDIEWPYKIPVYVLSKTLSEIPNTYKDKVFLVNGSLNEVIADIHKEGHFQLYIDGGATIQSFLKEDLIDDLIITTIPIILGGGTPLFTLLNNELNFDLIASDVYLNQLVQSSYSRKRE